MFGPSSQNALFKVKLTSLKTTSSRGFFVIGDIGNNSSRLELNKEVQYKEHAFQDFGIRVFNEKSELIDSSQLQLLNPLLFYQQNQLKSYKDIILVSRSKGKISEVTIEFSITLDNNTKLEISNFKGKVQSKIHTECQNLINKRKPQYQTRYDNTRNQEYSSNSYSGNDGNLTRNAQRQNNYTDYKGQNQYNNEYSGQIKINGWMQDSLRYKGNENEKNVGNYISGVNQTDNSNEHELYFVIKNFAIKYFCCYLNCGIMLCRQAANCCKRRHSE